METVLSLNVEITEQMDCLFSTIRRIKYTELNDANLIILTLIGKQFS